jgi:hypothetical protein
MQAMNPSVKKIATTQAGAKKNSRQELEMRAVQA